jgi:hypothetical protein
MKQPPNPRNRFEELVAEYDDPSGRAKPNSKAALKEAGPATLKTRSSSLGYLHPKI